VNPLVAAFRDAVPHVGAARPSPLGEDLGELLQGLLARGRAAHADLQVTPEAFARCLARSIEGEAVASLERIALEDLYLACACAERVPGAATSFEVRFGRTIRVAVSRVLAGSADRDEAAQRTRQALLVGSDDTPAKIAQYLGHGSLEGWIRIAAIRLAISLGRSEGAERRVRDKAVTAMTDHFDPETLYLKSELRPELEAAVEEALERLEGRQRLLLRLYLVSGMTLAAIGKSFGVSQSTVSALLVKTRRSVLAGVRQRLKRRLGVSKSDLPSIARLVASQLNVSIARLLADR
jgi:RNA polymerase sigma-70 factor, ECF subfamily